MLRSLAPVWLLLVGCAHSPLVTLAPTDSQEILIRDVSVLDVDTGLTTPHRNVLVRGDRIVSIDQTGTAESPSGVRVIPGEGGTLLPGLVDAHAHLFQAMAPPWSRALPDLEKNLQAFLYCGVTTVLDPADLTPAVLEWREEVARGALLGPRIFAAGPAFTAPGGHPVAMIRALLPWWQQGYVVSRLARQIATPADAEAAVADLASRKVDVIKIIADSIPPDAPRLDVARIEAIVQAARAHGLRAVAHIATTRDALETGKAGVAAWLHGVYAERIPDDAIDALAGFHIPMVPTLVVFESYALLGQGKRQATRLEQEIASPALLASFDDVPWGDPRLTTFGPFLNVVRGHRQDARDNVRRLRAAGVQILAGSDAQPGVFPGASLHRELHLLVESGLSPAEAIRAATSDAARFLSSQSDPDFGIIAAGKRADLLLVTGDPTSDLDALADIRAVITAGRLLDRHVQR